MKQAILITAYKNVDQLKDLLQAFDETFFFFIHLDKRSSITESEIDDLKNMPRVICVSKEYEVRWGGVNHLKAILLLLKLAFADKDYDYFHLITGQDYPTKSAKEITTFLEKNKGSEFIEYHKLPYSSWPKDGLDRLEEYNLFDHFDGREGLGRSIIFKLKKIQQILGLKRKFAANFPDLYGGGTYWTLSHDCIAYVINYLNEHPNYLPRFNYSFCAEELFFQTIILNSSFKDKVINNHLRFIVWDTNRDSFPAILDERDQESVLASDALFARKIDLKRSKMLLQKIKERVFIP